MSDALKEVWAKLYSWALPSALMLGAVWFLALPQLTWKPAWLVNAEGDTQAGIFIAFSALIAFVLFIFSRGLYRILEGYLFWPGAWFAAGVAEQTAQKQELQNQFNNAQPGLQQALLAEKLALYPIDNGQITPTRFGNALRAFETYGKRRYNLDSQTLWHELCSVAPEYLQQELMNARASTDFMVASVYLSAVFGVTALILTIFMDCTIGLPLLGGGALLLAFICHSMLVPSTGEWAATVQALVNLGRVKLAEELSLKLPVTLAEERQMWGLVTQYVAYAMPATGSALDQYRKPVAAEAADEES